MPKMGRTMGTIKAPSVPTFRVGHDDWKKYAVRGRSDKEKTKDRISYLKDAYVFAQNNKEYLDDPEVNDLLMQKLEKAEVSPVFQRGPTTDQAMMGGDPQYAQIDPDKQIHSLYQRFMMEHPSVYKPTEGEEYDEKRGYTGKRHDPISGETSYFTPMTTLSEGQEQVIGGKEPSVYYKNKKTATPKAPGDEDPTKGKKLAYSLTNPNDAVYAAPDPKTGAAPDGRTFTKPTSKGELTEKNILDIVNGIEVEMAQMQKDGETPTQEIVDRWNRQLEGIGLTERVELEDAMHPVDWWWDTKFKKAKLSKSTFDELQNIWRK